MHLWIAIFINFLYSFVVVVLVVFSRLFHLEKKEAKKAINDDIFVVVYAQAHATICVCMCMWMKIFVNFHLRACIFNNNNINNKCIQLMQSCSVQPVLFQFHFIYFVRSTISSLFLLFNALVCFALFFFILFKFLFLFLMQ